MVDLQPGEYWLTALNRVQAIVTSDRRLLIQQQTPPGMEEVYSRSGVSCMWADMTELYEFGGREMWSFDPR